MDELARLRVSDLKEDENGYLCVLVRKGKSEKAQYQRILPSHIDTVKEIFSDIGPDEYVFSKDEMNNKMIAINKGLPTEYNRLALMAVSVFHQSHWRVDVTVTNYMLNRRG